MLDISSPESLSSRAVFRQAMAYLRQTSRASNPDWYKDGMLLDHQWHLVVLGGYRVHSVLLAGGGEGTTWASGPAVNLTNPPTPEQVDALLDDILTRPEFRKARSLGVVVHLADEFATTEILSETRSVSSLAELKKEVIVSPSTALGDPSLSNETTSTRLIPYAGAQRPPLAATVTLSRTHAGFVDTLRARGEARNFPVQVATVSAPLVFLSILPAFLQFQEGRPQFVLLHYPKFSCLAVFNTESNLVQLRSLPHRGRSFPGNLGDAVNTALDALDLQSPVITILPLGDADPSPLLTQLHATLNKPEQAEVHILRPAVDSLAPEVPDLRPEMLVSVPQFASGEVSAGFKQLFQDRWAMQDFMPVPDEIQALYPTAADMRLLAAGRGMIAALAFGMVGLVAFAMFSILRTVSDPAWRHDPADTVTMQERLTKVQREVEELDHWENLLQERTKGWTAMELLARLFPDDSGVKVSNFKQTTRLDAVIKNNRVGFTREWYVRGLASSQAIPLLNKLNGREGVTEVFDDMLKATGNGSFNANVPGRNLVVLMERSKNPAYVKEAGMARNDDRKFFYVFDLKITQTFGPEDPMAVSTKSLIPR